MIQKHIYANVTELNTYKELLLLIFSISQGSVVKHKVRWKIWHEPCCKFTAESNSERILKIGRHFSKLWTNIEWHIFMDHRLV